MKQISILFTLGVAIYIAISKHAENKQKSKINAGNAGSNFEGANRGRPLVN